MPAEPTISFEALTARQLPLLEEWLNQPHMQEWWGDPVHELNVIRDMIEGRDTTQPYIFYVDNRPAGYIQVWFVGDHQNAEWLENHPWLAALPANAIGVDLSIGEADLLSCGIGSAALQKFTESLRSEGYDTIVIDPDRNNIRAVRAYHKAGFQPITNLLDKTGDILLMQYQPSNSDQSAPL